MDKYFNLGNYSRPITTSVAAAQTWFNRGLIWCYGFNQEEAARCFEKVIEFDDLFEATHGFFLIESVAPDQTAVKPYLCRLHRSRDWAIIITEVEVFAHRLAWVKSTLSILISLPAGMD